MKWKQVRLIEHLLMLNLPSYFLHTCQMTRNVAFMNFYLQEWLTTHVAKVMPTQTCHMRTSFGLFDNSFALTTLTELFIPLQKLYDILFAVSLMLFLKTFTTILKQAFCTCYWWLWVFGNLLFPSLEVDQCLTGLFLALPKIRIREN